MRGEPAMRPTFFANCSRDRVWSIGPAGGRTEEERLESGWAWTRELDGTIEIHAGDFSTTPSGPFELDRDLKDLPVELELRTTHQLGALFDLIEKAAIPPPLRLRSLASTRYVSDGRSEDLSDSLMVSIQAEHGGVSHSLITVPSRWAADVAFLRQVLSRRAGGSLDYHNLPLVWERGTGAVLLHEAIGHPAEIGRRDVRWPEWLSVSDEPAGTGLVQFDVDDACRVARPARLTSGEAPRSLRRESYRDVPRRRMSNLLVSVMDPAFDRPTEYIEILIVGGGHFDPLTDNVTVSVIAADHVRNGDRVRLRPFLFSEAREAIAANLAGGAEEVVPYPGVICFNDGQRIAVGSAAPALITSEFRR